MAYDANLIGKPREIAAFVKAETVAGTLVFPAGSDAIYIAGNPELTQQPSYTDSPEFANTLDITARAQDQTPDGRWSLPVLLRASGTAGNPPQHGTLYEALMGNVDDQATYVDYVESQSKGAFSLWWATGPICLFARGCTVSEAKVTINNKGWPTIAFSGGLMEMGHAGVTQLSGAHSVADTTILVDDASLFSVGARIWNVTADDDNTSSGYAVTAVDTSTNILTITPGISGAWGDRDEIKWFLPTAAPATSYAIESRLTTITVAGVTKTVKSIDLTIGAPVQYLTDEITTSGFPSAYLEQQRAIKGTVNLNVRPADVTYLTALSGTVAVAVTVGNVAGKKATFTLPYAALDIPSVSVQEPVEFGLTFTALGSAGEDSATIRFF